MSFEQRESSRIIIPPIYEVRLNHTNERVQVDYFISRLRELPFYRPGLLFSGYNGIDIGKQFYNDPNKNLVYCSTEQGIKGSAQESEPFRRKRFPDRKRYSFEESAFAESGSNRPNSTLIVYNPDKMEEVEDKNNLKLRLKQYRIKDSSAILAILKIK